MSVEFDRDVAVITWNDVENRIHRESLASLHAILDELQTRSGPLAVVLTGTGKFFSNGVDLVNFGHDLDELRAIFKELHRTIARLVVYPAYTVGALNGHTFAGGALIACALDHRVMREDRGFWCMNEADIGLPLDEKLSAILFNRLPRASAIEAMLTARRYGGPDARSAGMVEEVASESDVLARAVAVAGAMAGKDRAVLAKHKRLAHRALVTTLGYPEFLEA